MKSKTLTQEIVKDFNKCIRNGTFPKSFKISEVILVYKKDESYDKNY